LYLFFFFQAEDGIRDFHVTGVQTCALPIYGCVGALTSNQLCRTASRTGNLPTLTGLEFDTVNRASQRNVTQRQSAARTDRSVHRSEERRVGKEWRTRWSRD